MIMGMKKLLSLPPNLVDCFHAIEHVSTEEWFCTSDPVGARLGSGGGTTWLLEASRRKEAPDVSVEEWLGQEKRILLHAGGQSRRLPGICAIRENIDSDPCVSLGKRAEVIPELIVFAITSL